MTLKNIISLVFVCVFSFGINAQEKVISILEKDRDGGYEKNKKEYTNNPIVDINSILQIDLSNTVIIEKIRGNTTGVPQALEDKIKVFAEILKTRNDILKAFNTTLNKYNYDKFSEDKQANEAWAAEMSTYASRVLTIAEKLEDEGVTLQGYRPKYIYDAAEKELNKLTEAFDEYASKEGIYVQFGAWLYNNGTSTPIHLPGFDSIAPKPPYEVQRWQVVPTKEQLKQLEEFSELAKENRDTGLLALKTLVDNQLEYLKKILSVELKKIVDQIKTDLDNLSTTSGISEIVSDFTNFKNELETFEKKIELRVSYYEGLKLNNINTILQTVSEVKSDIELITTEGKELYNKSVTIYDKIKVLANQDNLKKIANELKTYIDSWVKTALNNDIIDGVEGLLSGTPIDFSSLKFSDKVLKLSLKDIPKQTDLDLYTTGKRESGDRIAFKFQINSKKKLIYQENREVYMYKILLHLQGSVGVVFADPLANTSVKTQFQMAPSYNLILKGLWDQKIRRKSIAYNRIFDWGIGLHMSAPDFDADDVPELGVGMVVSLLHDYVQSGIAVNVFTGDPYWFFGLKLPVPTFNLGTVNTTNTTN